ncbi:endo-1,4-beta-xylanase [Microbulbifer elongatus]|uniref:endo-1,4-beta-xylanase n=1 Tax=Microbulbifer elongatus TaxID=86173 RepID=UPI001E47553A|nr:endo-1,4-beta-xylanase [Microbulbifer elongatus]
MQIHKEAGSVRNTPQPGRHRHTHRIWRLAPLLLAVCTGAAGNAFAGCEYSVSNDWGSGFVAHVRVTNDSSVPVQDWQVQWQYSGDNRVTNAWNAEVQGDNPYTASNVSWNGSLQPGQTVEFGFQGTSGSFAETPAVSGALCDGGSSSGGSSSSSSSSSGGSSSSSGSSSSGGSSSSSSSSSSGGTTEHLYSLASFPIGVAVAAGDSARSFLKIPQQEITIRQHFSQITAENIMKMRFLHPAENTYDFTDADQMVDWALTNGLSVHGHTFIWHHEYQVPDWMKSYSGDFQSMLNTHVATIADHFAGRVVSWDVVNEVLDETQSNCYRDTLFYQRLGRDYVSEAFIAAESADPAADLYYNDYSISGGNSAKFNCLLTMLDELQADGAPIDGVGLQMHIQIDWPTTDHLRSAFQAIVERGLKVKITELDVPVNNPYSSAPFPQHTEFTPEVAALQKARYKAIVQTYLEEVPPALRGGISVWGLWDGDSWILDFENWQGADDWPLLFSGPANGPYEEKPALEGVAEALLGQ